MQRTHDPKPLTWNDYKRTAFGVMGLHPWEFYEYTVEEFILKLQGHVIKNTDQWKQTRLILFGLAKMGGSKVKKPEDLLRLPGEEGGGTSFRNKSPEERKKWIEQVRKAFKKQYKDEINQREKTQRKHGGSK